MANQVRTPGMMEGTGFLFAAGHIAVNSTTATLTEVSGPQFFASDISLIRVGAGRYQVTLRNFRGPTGFVVPAATAGSSSTAALGTTVPALPTSISLNSYTTGTDTYSFTISIASSNTFTDADCYWTAFAF